MENRYQHTRFLRGAVRPGQAPPDQGREVAFAGRSNSGKSSALNAITGQKALARTSKTPGRTREINFFDLEGMLRLVDLPGFGYAKASRKEAENWMRLTRAFLRGRQALRRVCLLVDSRHGLKPTDLDVMDLLDETAVNYQIVLTKADKIKPTALQKVRQATLQKIAKRPAAHPIIMATSSETGEGIEELRAELAALSAT